MSETKIAVPRTIDETLSAWGHCPVCGEYDSLAYHARLPLFYVGMLDYLGDDGSGYEDLRKIHAAHPQAAADVFCERFHSDYDYFTSATLAVCDGTGKLVQVFNVEVETVPSFVLAEAPDLLVAHTPKPETEEDPGEEKREPCKKCGQIDNGQTGEYPCSECGLPTILDDPLFLRPAPTATPGDSTELDN